MGVARSEAMASSSGREGTRAFPIGWENRRMADIAWEMACVMPFHPAQMRLGLVGLDPWPAAQRCLQEGGETG